MALFSKKITHPNTWRFAQYFAWILLGVFALFVRTWKLDKIPTTLMHDELVYAIQAKSLAVQGTTWDQRLGWGSLKPIDPLYAELPAHWMVPFFKLGISPLLATHLPWALGGAAIPFLLAGLSYQLWRDQKLSWWVAVVATFNPVQWQYSRMSFDPLPGVACYLAGGWLFLHQKFWIKLLAIPWFLLGFFQYQGLKLILVPWVLGLILLKIFQKYSWEELRLCTKKPVPILSKIGKTFIGELAILGGLLVLVGWYLGVQLPSQNVGNRLNFLIWKDAAYLQQEVNVQRRLSLSSELIPLTINKGTEIVNFMVYRFFGAFELKRLFFQMDPSRDGYAAWRHGMFYLLDLPLLLFGIGYYLSEKRTRLSALIFLGLLPVVCLPAYINTMSEWYIFRCFFGYTLLTIPIGWGLRALPRTQIWQLGVSGLYLAAIVWFGMHYFYRYPVYSADFGRLFERITATYIGRITEAHPETEVVVYLEDDTETRYFFAAYLLYRQLFSAKTAPEIANAVQNKQWQLGQVQFISQTGKPCYPEPKPNQVVIAKSGLAICPKLKNLATPTEGKTLSLPAILDSGDILRITNDPLCQSFDLKTFIHPSQLAQFSIEQLSNPDLCQDWFTKHE